jgi:glycosyltransferase involved in cell wall biosynthesis
MTTSEDVEISVIIPCRNEEENVGAIAAAVIAELSKETQSYEVIFIDNASTDRTVELAKALCAENPRLRLIVNNRNYGQMRSPTHAIYQTRGRAVIGICADFQDPPPMIGEFIRRWRAGAHIVLATRRTEDSPPLVKLTRFVGYRLLNRVADYPIISGATGFGLYSREVVDALKAWREPEPFFRGMLVESGYRLETIPYERPPRAGGRTNNNVFTLADFGLSALAGSAKGLLRAPFYFFVFVLLASVAILVGAAVDAVVLRRWPWGWLATSAAAFGFSWVFLFLALLGDQVRLIADRTRNVPLVIEEERVNF